MGELYLSVSCAHQRQLWGSDRLLTHHDRSAPSGWLRPFSVGGDFALRVHFARLADRAGGGACAAVIHLQTEWVTLVISKANFRP